MKSVRSTMMLGNLSIGVWTATLKDKSKAKEIESGAKAKAGSAGVTKKLLPGAPELEQLQKQATTDRNWWATQSVPWFDNGPRGYNATRHMDIVTEVGARRQTFMDLRDIFLRAYPSLRAQAKYDLGDWFKEEEFPPPDIVRSKFHYDFDTCTVPNTEDVRVIETLDEDEVEALVAEQVKAQNAKVQAGMQTAAERLFKLVQHMHNKLSIPIPAEKKDKKGKLNGESYIFRDSLIENIAEMVDVIMPGLNITGDPKLDKLCEQAKKLTLYSPEELRSDNNVRGKAANEAKALAGKLQGLFT